MEIPFGYPGIMEVWRLQALHLFKINVQSAWITISKGDIDGSQGSCFLCR
jgi:hypothetical protein